MKVAILSLISDAGHVVPLLKIANVLQSQAHEVLYLGPSETQILAESKGICFVDIGPVRPPSFNHCLKVLTAKTNMWRYMLYGIWFDINYMEASVFNGYEKKNLLLNETKKFDPDILVVDDHFFLEAFNGIANELGKPLIVNNSEGSFHKELVNMPFKKDLRYFYYTAIKHVLETGYYIYKWLASPLLMARRNTRKKLLSRARSFGIEALLKNFSNVQAISPGISYLETLYVTERISNCHLTKAMGPLPITIANKLEHEIKDWLDVRDDVLFVSFGTMIHADDKLIKKILSAARELHFRILWAAPECPDEIFAGNDASKYKWARWVSQTDVLAHENVRVFVSHGGAGAIQEAIWFGVPMVIIPHIWDQYYNARRAEQFEIAINLDRENISKEKIRVAIQNAMNLSNRVQEVSQTFRLAECSETIVAMINSYAQNFNSSDKPQLNKGKVVDVCTI